MVAGVDVGTDYTQAALVEDGDLLAVGETRTGFDLDEAVEDALADAHDDLDGASGDLDGAGGELDVETVVVTGDRVDVDADEWVPTDAAVAQGLAVVWPDARSVLVMGAKNVTALRLDEDRSVVNSVENGKCAAGVGRFLSDLTRYLDVDLDGMIEAALDADEGVSDLNAQCSVFAESEVISLVHEGVPQDKIARGVFEAVAGRNGAMLKRVGIEEDVVVVGGVGRNRAFVEALSENVGTAVHAPEHPAHVPAYGAALSASSGPA